MKYQTCWFLKTLFEYTQKNTTSITCVKFTFYLHGYSSVQTSLNILIFFLIIKIQVVKRELHFVKKQNESFKPIKCHCCPYIETNQLICSANRLTGIYIRATLALSGLNKRFWNTTNSDIKTNNVQKNVWKLDIRKSC